MTNSSKPLPPVTIDLNAIAAGIPRHVSYRPNAPRGEEKQPTWYTQLKAQEWKPTPVRLNGGDSDVWGGTMRNMMTRMESVCEDVSLQEPSIDGFRLTHREDSAPSASLALPPLPPKVLADLPVRPAQRDTAAAPPVDNSVAAAIRPRPTPVINVRDTPTPPQEHLDRQVRAAAARHEHALRFAREASKPPIRSEHATSTVGDRTENLPAPPAPGAAKEMVNTMLALKARLPRTESSKQKQAQSLANWLRNTGLVGLDADANDVVLRRFTNNSNKLGWVGLRDRFPGVNEQQAARLTIMLARKWKYQDLEDWLAHEPSMTAAVYAELNPDDVPKT